MFSPACYLPVNYYIKFKNLQTVSANLSWSHYVEILKIDNIDKLKYYIYITSKLNLSVRELRERIKSNEYERIGNKIEL